MSPGHDTLLLGRAPSTSNNVQVRKHIHHLSLNLARWCINTYGGALILMVVHWWRINTYGGALIRMVVH